jgi:hypothetical protein
MQFIKNLLNEQRKRAVGNLMRHIETKVYPHLPPAECADLRAKVIGALGQYHDTCLDIVKASVADGSVLNDEALVVLARMEGALADLRREVDHAER